MGTLLAARAPADGARFTVTKRMWWAGALVEVGRIVRIDDPATARQLHEIGRIAPVDNAARELLRAPAKWIAPRDTSIHPGGPGIMARSRFGD